MRHCLIKGHQGQMPQMSIKIKLCKTSRYNNAAFLCWEGPGLILLRSGPRGRSIFWTIFTVLCWKESIGNKFSFYVYSEQQNLINAKSMKNHSVCDRWLIRTCCWARVGVGDMCDREPWDHKTVKCYSCRFGSLRTVGGGWRWGRGLGVGVGWGRAGFKWEVIFPLTTSTWIHTSNYIYLD